MEITLLDGKTYNREDLITKASDDSYYYGYLGKYAFSSTSMKHLLDSPKTYKHILEYGTIESQALRDGWLFHAAVLEPEVFESQIFVDCQSKNTKKYKDALAEHGKVFTMKEKHDAERLADALLRNEMVLQKLNDSDFEVAEIGEIGFDSIKFPFRAKADVLGNNSTMYDLKSTSSLKGWQYSADKYGYDVQAFIYSQLFDILPNRMGFIVIEKGSLDIGYAQVTEEFYLRGQAKVKRALEIYEEWFMQEADLDQYYINIEL
jgi:hypothetical protein|tara:strand:+ start:122 stop:907 length:786 start_codon:yes stop_codon:yes gene_type:complete